MLCAVSELSDVELSEVEATVGTRSFQRGRSYARANRVVTIEWDPHVNTLTGSVVGQGALYDTAAFFTVERDGALTLDDGECTCPVGYNCKHVAALVIAAADGRAAGRPAARSVRSGRVLGLRSSRQVATAAQPHSWEEPLRALASALAAPAAGIPLAIELTLQASGLADAGPPRLMARLMREGARGGWVNGSLSWSGLDSWQVQSGKYRSDHLALVRELYAIYRAREGRIAYSYGYGADKALDLGSCDSVQLWSLLEEAARLGVKFVHASPGLGEVRCHQRGELLIDVTRGGAQGWHVRSLLRVDGEDEDRLEPLLFMGSSGHGVVCAERGDGEEPDNRRLRLVRLARSATPRLQRMMLDGELLKIPASKLERFADALCPSLRHVARVVSSDDSFSPPEISAPTLVLRASYGAGHALDVGWEWVYRVGAATHHTALASNGTGPGFRDLEAERAILEEVDFTGTDLEPLGLLDGVGRPADAHTASLAGIDSMRFTTEGLPLLVERSDIVVEVIGEPADYRDVGGSLTVGLSTTEVAGESDWFDLGVTISLDGRELPFAEVFAALASGQSQILLDDGAHFSLLEPRLQELRRLIEEARALSDSPTSSLRISRYQAGLWAELVALGVVREQAQAWQRQVGALLELDTIAVQDPPSTLAE